MTNGDGADKAQSDLCMSTSCLEPCTLDFRIDRSVATWLLPKSTFCDCLIRAFATPSSGKYLDAYATVAQVSTDGVTMGRGVWNTGYIMLEQLCSTKKLPLFYLSMLKSRTAEEVGNDVWLFVLCTTYSFPFIAFHDPAFHSVYSTIISHRSSLIWTETPPIRLRMNLVARACSNQCATPQTVNRCCLHW